MQMPCCLQHHGSYASMCLAYWMIMTKWAISPVSTPAEQWLQIGRCVLSNTWDSDSNANQSCCPLKYICTCRAGGNNMKPCLFWYFSPQEFIQWLLAILTYCTTCWPQAGTRAIQACFCSRALRSNYLSLGIKRCCMSSTVFCAI